MALKELHNKLAEISVDLKQWIDTDAPRIFGKTAVDIYERNFQNEGFLNNGLQPWQQVKRRIAGSKAKGAAGSRKILTDSGKLGSSFKYKPGNGEVRIYNNARSASGFPYGQVHNNGATDAGRNRNVIIPKRQIIGESAELNRLCEMEITRKLKSLFK